MPNAFKDENWKNNPDIKLNMVSYLGLPVLLPNGRPFGTICVLDNMENPYSSGFIKLILTFRDLIQSDIEIIYVNKVLADENKRLNDYISEIQTLRGILPICMHCKKIRDDKGFWNQIEAYLAEHSEVKFSHSICRECAKKLYPDMDLFDDI